MFVGRLGVVEDGFLVIHKTEEARVEGRGGGGAAGLPTHVLRLHLRPPAGGGERGALAGQVLRVLVSAAQQPQRGGLHLLVAPPAAAARVLVPVLQTA